MKLFGFKTGMCALLLTLYGCAPTIKVSTDYDRAADFSSFHTFTLVDISAKGEVSELNAYRIRRSITEVMTEKGFVETGEDADLLVNAVTVVKTKREITASTDYYGYGGVYRPYGYWGGGGGTTTTFNTNEYKDGSLIIDVVNKKAQKLLWQGIGNAEIDKMPDNPDQFMLKAVRKILAGFPPTALNK